MSFRLRQRERASVLRPSRSIDLGGFAGWSHRGRPTDLTKERTACTSTDRATRVIRRTGGPTQAAARAQRRPGRTSHRANECLGIRHRPTTTTVRGNPCCNSKRQTGEGYCTVTHRRAGVRVGGRSTTRGSRMDERRRHILCRVSAHV